MTRLSPRTEAELADIVAESAAARRPLELVGRGTKRALGRPLQVEATLDLSAFAGVVTYEPEELILTLRPATPLAEVEALLRERGQMLAFEPCDWGPLLGQPAAAGSLGGVMGCNLAGPRRFKAGAARDHLLGLTGVTGDGARFQAGGKVVKNVTGYDICKLAVGSWGTLVAMTEVTVKVLPAPEKTRTLLLFGLERAAATALMGLALGSSCDVSGAAWLPAGLAARCGVDLVSAPGKSVTALRLEGHEPSVVSRLASLRALMAANREREELHGKRSGAFWQAVRDARPFVGQDQAVWRLSVTPRAAPEILDWLGVAGEEAYLDWGGGLIWLARPAEAPLLPALPEALARFGGQGMLLRGPAAARRETAFSAEPPALRQLARRVKASFDPQGIFNPGRLHAGG